MPKAGNHWLDNETSLKNNSSALTFKQNHWLDGESLKTPSEIKLEKNVESTYEAEENMKMDSYMNENHFSIGSLKTPSEIKLEKFEDNNTETNRFIEKDLNSIENEEKNKTTDFVLKAPSEIKIEKLAENTESGRYIENYPKIVTNGPVFDLSAKKIEQSYQTGQIEIKMENGILNKAIMSNSLNITETKDDPLTCTFCRQKCSSKRALRKHEKIHTLTPRQTVFPCNYCQLKYITKQSLINHQFTCSKKDLSQDLSLKYEKAPSLENPDFKYFDIPQNVPKIDIQFNVVQSEIQSNGDIKMIENKIESLDHSKVSVNQNNSNFPNDANEMVTSQKVSNEAIKSNIFQTEVESNDAHKMNENNHEVLNLSNSVVNQKSSEIIANDEKLDASQKNMDIQSSVVKAKVESNDDHKMTENGHEALNLSNSIVNDNNTKMTVNDEKLDASQEIPSMDIQSNLIQTEIESNDDHKMNENKHDAIDLSNLVVNQGTSETNEGSLDASQKIPHMDIQSDVV